MGRIGWGIGRNREDFQLFPLPISPLNIWPSATLPVVLKVPYILYIYTYIYI